MPAFLQHVTGVTTMLGCYMQRCSASFGLNSSPTVVDVDLVPGNPNDYVSVAHNATGFVYASGEPGTLNRFKFGALDFVGLVRSYSDNFGTDGRKYSVSLTDPRVIFPNVVLSLDGHGLGTGTYVPNYFNVFNYYGSPQAADSNRYGMTFSKIRDFLTASGNIINAWGNRLQLEFSSGFQNLVTGTNPSGIPSWYRITSNQSSVEQILQQVCDDFNFDYFAYVKTSTFDVTGINTVVIQHIFRNADVAGSSEVSGFINSALASGVRINYQYGKELRTEPTEVVMYGPSLTYWKCPATSEIQKVWGETNNGTLVTNGFTTTNGVVLLDHIVGSGSSRIVSEVAVQNIDYYKATTGISYPPQITRVFSTTNVKGYEPSENTLRAALYSQESWESILFQEHQSFAQELGIPVQRFMGTGEMITQPAQIWEALSLSRIGSGVSDRDKITENVIQSVFEATRQTAEEYYGTTWLIRLGSSNWLASGTFDSSDLSPEIEFTCTDAAWSEPNKGVGSGSTLNHPTLQSSSNLNFKSDLGLTKNFLSVHNYETSVDNTYFPHPIDLSQLDRNAVMLEQGNKMVVPVSCQCYDKEPSKAIVRINSVLEGLTDPSGYIDQRPYYMFLRAMGYNDTQIRAYNMLEAAGENQAYGLAPRRLHHNIPISSDVYGFFLAVERNEKNFGPFIATGIRHGGCNVMQDSSLGPWTYGNNTVYTQAGNDMIGRAFNGTTSVESAQINIAGLPVYNIGEKFGENANITALSIQIGQDGLTTAYTVKTFAYPRTAATKTLQDKAVFVGGLNQKYGSVTNLNNALSYQDYDEYIRRDADIALAKKQARIEDRSSPSPNRKKKPSQGSQSNTYLYSIVKRSPSGIYPSGTSLV